MSAPSEDTPTSRRSTRERKKVEPFVSGSSSRGQKRKNPETNERDEGSGRRKRRQKQVKLAEQNVKSIELHPLASGALPTPWEGFRSLRDETENRMIYFGFDATGDSIRPAIFVLDCGSRKSQNITADLQCVSDDGQPLEQPFPHLSHPSVALFKPQPDETFLLVFGGENKGRNGSTSSTMYYIDITRKTWGEVDPGHDRKPQPRVGATTCVVGSRLYIFGGRLGGKVEAKSYSLGVLIFDRPSGRISLGWALVDKAYPKTIPYSGFFGGFALLDGGKSILLLPGGRRNSETGGEEVNFSKEEVLTLYDTGTDAFTSIPSGGLKTLPTVCWYHPMLPPAQGLSKLPQFEVGRGKYQPTSFLVSNTVLPTTERNSHIAHLWAVSVYTTQPPKGKNPETIVQVKKLDVEKEIKRIRGANKVDFFAFFTTADKLYFLGVEGDEPVEGSAYIADIKL